MNQKNLVRYSKSLSLVLRHNPQSIKIILDNQGWTSVAHLLQQMNAHGKRIDMSMLEHIVAHDSKTRFSFNSDKTKIRANQGHSVTVDLGYTSQVPPTTLYHGTASRFVDKIYEAGAIQKMQRHHVHLSSDIHTASVVGKRHGRLVIFEIDTKSMIEKGYEFFISDNNVWLVNEIPTQYITQLESI